MTIWPLVRVCRPWSGLIWLCHWHWVVVSSFGMPLAPRCRDATCCCWWFVASTDLGPNVCPSNRPSSCGPIWIVWNQRVPRYLEVASNWPTLEPEPRCRGFLTKMQGESSWVSNGYRDTNSTFGMVIGIWISFVSAIAYVHGSSLLSLIHSYQLCGKDPGCGDPKRAHFPKRLAIVSHAWLIGIHC